MHYFRFLAHPTGAHPEHNITGGAFVHCWLKEPVQGAAKMIAIGVIEQEGWRIEALEEVREVTREDYAGDPDALARLETAELDGMVFHFEKWVADARRRAS